MSVGANIQTINLNNVQSKMQTNFRSQSSPVKDYPPDTVEINGKKETGMSSGTKWGISLGLVTLGTILAIALTRGKGASKEIKQLAEHLEFKEAKTMEEAKKFAKDNFGMKLEVNNNLTAANFFNKICTNVNNRFKGKAVLPEKIQYKEGDKGRYNNMSWGVSTKSLNIYGVPQAVLKNANMKGENIFKDNGYQLLILSAYHELGHAQHYAFCKNATKMGNLQELIERRVSDKHYLEEFLQEIKKTEIQEACNKFFTSDYCKTSPAEFVAETFAWKMMGKSTPKEIEELYLKYGGAPIPN